MQRSGFRCASLQGKAALKSPRHFHRSSGRFRRFVRDPPTAVANSWCRPQCVASNVDDSLIQSICLAPVRKAGRLDRLRVVRTAGCRTRQPCGFGPLLRRPQPGRSSVVGRVVRACTVCPGHAAAGRSGGRRDRVCAGRPAASFRPHNRIPSRRIFVVSAGIAVASCWPKWLPAPDKAPITSERRPS